MITPHGHVYRTLQRFNARDGLRFLTFSCNHRWPLFHNDAIKNAYADQLHHLVSQGAIRLRAWVIMPEHVHLLLIPSPGTTSRRMATQLKASFARRVIARWIELKAPVLPKLEEGRGKYQFWLPGGGYDRNIFSDEEYREKIRYIHQNPVRRGLVSQPTDWAWSSARWYAGMREGVVK